MAGLTGGTNAGGKTLKTDKEGRIHCLSLLLGKQRNGASHPIKHLPPQQLRACSSSWKARLAGCCSAPAIIEPAHLIVTPASRPVLFILSILFASQNSSPPAPYPFY